MMVTPSTGVLWICHGWVLASDDDGCGDAEGIQFKRRSGSSGSLKLEQPTGSVSIQTSNRICGEAVGPR
jgi:hypothetical protein